MLQVLALILVFLAAGAVRAEMPVVFSITFMLCLISALRHQVGVDFNTYFDYYTEISVGKEAPAEYGFVMLARFCEVIGVGFQGLIFVYSLLIAYFSSSSFIKFSSRPALSVYIFAMLPILYLASFNIMRQFLAVTIFLFSLRYIASGRMYSYILTIAAAALVAHKSIILMLPLYFILGRKLNFWHYGLVALLYIALLQFLEILIELLGFSSVYLGGAFENTGVNFLVVAYAIIFLMIFLMRGVLVRKLEKNVIFVNMAFFSMLVSLTPLLTDLPTAPILRMSSYFTIGLPILFANMINIFYGVYTRFFLMIGLIIPVTVYFYATLYFNGAAYKLTPYRTFIFE